MNNNTFTNTTVPIGDDDDSYMIYGDALTLVVLVVAIISIVFIAIVTYVCVQRRRKRKTKFTIISPDLTTEEEEENNRLKAMPMSVFTIPTDVGTSDDDEEKTGM